MCLKEARPLVAEASTARSKTDGVLASESRPLFVLDRDLETQLTNPNVYFFHGHHYNDRQYLAGDTNFCLFEAQDSRHVRRFYFDKDSHFKVKRSNVGPGSHSFHAIFELTFEGTAWGLPVKHDPTVTLRLSCYQDAEALTVRDVQDHLGTWITVKWES